MEDGQKNTVDLEANEEEKRNETEPSSVSDQDEQKTNNEENHEEKVKPTTSITASSNDPTTPQSSSSASSLPKPWLSYAHAVCQGLQSQLNDADQTLSTLDDQLPLDRTTIGQLREGQQKMRKVLKELNDLTAEWNTEQSCLKPKMVKESVDRSKNADRKKASDGSANANESKRPDEPANELVTEETGPVEEQATAGSEQPNSSEQATTGSERPASSEELTTTEQPASSEQLNSSEQPANLAETLSASLSSIVQNEFKCSICQELIINASGLSCSHVFCKCCIDEWLGENRRCPVCRKDIRSSSRRHHVLPIDNFLQLYFTKFGTSEQQAERTRLISERRSREVIVIEDDPPPPQSQVRANDLFYSFGFAYDGELPGARARNRHRRRRRQLNRLRTNRALAQPENAAGANENQPSSTTNPPSAVSLASRWSALEPTNADPIEIILGSRPETGTVAQAPRRPTPIVSSGTARASARRSLVNQLTSNRPVSPLLGPSRNTRRSRLTTNQHTQTLSTSPPTLEIVPIIELDEMNLDEDLSSLGLEIDLIELDDQSNQSNSSMRTHGSADGVRRPGQVRPRLRNRSRQNASRRRDRSAARRRRNGEITSNESTSNNAGALGSAGSLSLTSRPALTSALRPSTALTSTSRRTSTSALRTASSTMSLSRRGREERRERRRERRREERRKERRRRERETQRREREARRRESRTSANQTAITDQTDADPICQTTTDTTHTAPGNTTRSTTRRSARRRSRRRETLHGLPAVRETTSSTNPRSTNATRSSSSRLRTGSTRLARNRSADVRARREERRRARRSRRLDINDYLLDRKRQH